MAENEVEADVTKVTIGSVINYSTSRRTGRSITLSAHSGKVVAIRTVKQALVRPEKGKSEWVDLMVLEKTDAPKTDAPASS